MTISDPIKEAFGRLVQPETIKKRLDEAIENTIKEQQT